MVSTRDRATASPVNNPAPAWLPPFQRPAVEFGPVALAPLAGAVPAGLRGTLYRNGPARLQRGGVPYGHWFDGDGAVLAVAFDGGSARGTYRYVQTPWLRDEGEAGQPIYGNYGMMPAGNWFDRLTTPLKNAANTSVLPLADRVLALWEGGRPHALDRDRLDTLGEDDLGWLGADESFSAHPKVDPTTGAVFNFGVKPGPTATLNVYRFDDRGTLQTRSAIALDRMGLVHDCVWTGRYLVFCIPPVRLRLLPTLLKLASFSEALQWLPDEATQIIAIDGDTLEVAAKTEVSPWFQWHFGNGWMERDGAIAFDVCAYPNFDTNQYLSEVPTGRIETLAAAELMTVRLDPATGQLRSRSTAIGHHCEFPTVLASEVGQPNRYTYLSMHRPSFATPADSQGELMGAIARYDAHTGRIDIADAGAGRYPSEPIVVRDREGEGRWLLSTIYDGRHDRGECWIYDADAIAAGPVCRLALPEVVPPGFHGAWAPTAQS